MTDSRNELVRCDGCGAEASVAVRHTDDDGNPMVSYCIGCESERERRGVAPADHDQYKLLERDNAG